MYYFIYLTLKIIILILIFTSATGNEIHYTYFGVDAFASAEAIVSEVVKNILSKCQKDLESEAQCLEKNI